MSCAIKEAKRGRTHNPDIMCNSRIKLGWLIIILIPPPPLSIRPPTGGSNSSAHPTPSNTNSTSSSPSHKSNSNVYSSLSDTYIKIIYDPLHNPYLYPTATISTHEDYTSLEKNKFDSFLSVYLTNNPEDLVDADMGEVARREKGL